jgi:tRNA (cmo5U34)-methyltransferase
MRKMQPELAKIKKRAKGNKQVEAMLTRLKDDFYTLSTKETFALLSDAGFSQVHSFAQVLCYQGFIAQH